MDLATETGVDASTITAAAKTFYRDDIENRRTASAMSEVPNTKR
jgi:hypothetical protein